MAPTTLSLLSSLSHNRSESKREKEGIYKVGTNFPQVSRLLRLNSSLRREELVLQGRLKPFGLE